MSFIGQQTNQQSLNGIIDLTDGTISIVDGDISNVKSLSINGEINMNGNKIIDLEDGTNPRDAVNKAQLDAVSLNLNDYVKRDGTTSMTGSFNLANNKIINVATPTTGADGTNKSYVDNNFVNLTGIQTISGLKTFSNNVNLSSKKIINLANGTSLSDAINLTQLTAVNNSLSADITNLQTNYLKRDGTNTMTGSLNMNTTNKIINLATPSTGTDATNKNYVDTHTNNDNYLLRNGTLPMTGNLNLNSNYINNLANPTTGTDATNKTYVDTQDNLKVNKAGDTMTDVLTINKNATIQQNETTVITSFNISSSNTFYDYINFSGTSATVVIPKTNGGDSTMVNKAVYIYFPNTSTLTLSASAVGSCLINGGNWVNYVINIGTGGVRKVRIVGLSTIGSYTVESISGIDSIDQLTLKSNYGLNTNSEFSGINFNNNNTDVGYIRVESNRLNNNNSTMRFYNRVSNNLILPLEINSNINAYKPIIRNAWSSGELIQTKIYTQDTNGTGVQQINANSNGTGAYVDWKTISFTTLNTPTDSVLVVEVFAPYLYNGTLGDRLTSKIVDTTSSQTVVESGVSYINGAGGGARGMSFLPLVGSYTPTGTTKARSIKISFDNDGDDILYICRILPRGSVITDKNNYTIKVSEYKL